MNLRATLIGLCLASITLAESSLSPHFPAGASDLVPDKRFSYPATAETFITFKRPAQKAENNAADRLQLFPSEAPIRFIIKEETLAPDLTIRQVWKVNPILAPSDMENFRD